jgi:YD repeat-containing protein
MVLLLMSLGCAPEEAATCSIQGSAELALHLDDGIPRVDPRAHVGVETVGVSSWTWWLEESFWTHEFDQDGNLVAYGSADRSFEQDWGPHGVEAVRTYVDGVLAGQSQTVYDDQGREIYVRTMDGRTLTTSWDGDSSVELETDDEGGCWRREDRWLDADTMEYWSNGCSDAPNLLKTRFFEDGHLVQEVGGSVRNITWEDDLPVRDERIYGDGQMSWATFEYWRGDLTRVEDSAGNSAELRWDDEHRPLKVGDQELDWRNDGALAVFDGDLLQYEEGRFVGIEGSEPTTIEHTCFEPLD